MTHIFHGTPITPNDAFSNVMLGRRACVSFFRPDQVKRVEEVCASVMYDNGAFSEWQAASKRGEDWFVRADWTPYFSWLENRLFDGDRWAVIPDAPGGPSQVNDGLLNDWPFGRERGVPLWHMDGPVERLGRLCERYSRVALGWTGHPKVEPVGCPRYRKRMDEVAALLGATWPPIHMMRGVAVAFDYPFASADSTSLGQNGHRYDSPFDLIWGDRWAGRRAYADRLENLGKKRL